MKNLGKTIFCSMIVLMIVFLALIVLFLILAFSTPVYGVISSDTKPIGDLGKDQLLSCYLTTRSIDQLSVTWEKKGVEGFVYQYSNGAANPKDQNSQFRGRTEIFPDALVTGNASLLLKNVMHTDDGEYTCSISSYMGEGKVSIYLRTAAISYYVMSRNKTPIGLLGEDHLLSCYLAAQSISQVSVTWEKKGVEGFVYQYSNGAVSLRDQNSQFRGRTMIFPDDLVTGNASLLLRNVRHTDEGEYTCSIISPIGEGKVNISLTTEAISYNVMSSNKTPIGLLGEDQLLSCYLTKQNIDQVSVTWMKKGLEGFVYQFSNGAANLWDQNSQFGGRTEIFPDVLDAGNASLLLRNLRRTDDGEYTCNISSYTGQGKVDIYLRTAAISYNVMSTNKTPTILLGEDQLLSCYLTKQNIDQVSVTWLKKGVEGFVYQYTNGAANLSHQNPQFRGRTEIFPDVLDSGNASLLLQNVTRTDDGEYTCIISSYTGEGKVDINLRTAANSYDLKSSNKMPIAILGEDQLLSCYLTKRSISQVSLSWVKKGVEGFVYQYSNGAAIFSKQNSQFRGRTEIFPDDLVTGNASLLLRNVRRTDVGEYTCNISCSTGEGKVNITLRAAVKTCPAKWTMAQSSCYFLSTERSPWKKARDECRKRGADLVVINSAEEQKLISEISNRDVWIGVSDSVEEKSWMWTDGSPLTLAFWQPFQPDNGNGIPWFGEEDCAVLEPRMNYLSNWNDLRCDASRNWICEKSALKLI